MQIKELVEDVRSRIEKTEPCHHRTGLMATYLGCCRGSEVVSKGSPYGWRSEDVREATYNFNGSIEPIGIFTIRMAKARERVAKERYVALPLDPKYEPWARPLMEYCLKAKGPVFPYSYITLYRAAEKTFEGLNYSIEGYFDGTDKIKAHEREAATHFLRHIRASELRMLYHFGGEDLSDYGGWQFVGSGKVSKSMGRYTLIPDWHGYFPKLLTPRNQL
jgi:hypothetical protein